jgi:hypothetical protein
MTFYRSCTGCIKQGQPCDTRDALRKRLKGLDVTSVKWKCRDRIARIQVGDAVWVDTVADQNESGDDGQPFRGHFPGIAIRERGASMLVLIENGAPERDEGDDVTFATSGNGFCKIPLSRITARDAAREEICGSCYWPASKGHQPGYLCHHAEEEIRF